MSIAGLSKQKKVFWSHCCVFSLEKQSELFLLLKDPLVATFNETRVLTSRNYVAEKVMVFTNWSKIFQTF